MEARMESSWKMALKTEFEQPYFKQLASKVRDSYQTTRVYPPQPEVFRAFSLCPFQHVRVVILGQDPYHGPEQANGLCFAVNDGVRLPPSLRNIFKEIEMDLGRPVEQSGDLSRWATEGVLLLNATLTVEAGRAGSHQGWGWERFTDAVIAALSREREGLVFLLWGNYARKKGAHIDRTKHLVLESAHPSPLSAHNGFFGNKHFSQVNEYLKAHGQPPVVW